MEFSQAAKKAGAKCNAKLNIFVYFFNLLSYPPVGTLYSVQFLHVLCMCSLASCYMYVVSIILLLVMFIIDVIPLGIAVHLAPTLYITMFVFIS